MKYDNVFLYAVHQAIYVWSLHMKIRYYALGHQQTSKNGYYDNHHENGFCFLKIAVAHFIRELSTIMAGV